MLLAAALLALAHHPTRVSTSLDTNGSVMRTSSPLDTNGSVMRTSSPLDTNGSVMRTSSPLVPSEVEGPVAGPEHAQARFIPLPQDAIAYVPASADPHPSLLVLLHGAGHRQREMIEQFTAEADARGIVLLAPTSQGITWDSVATAEEPPSLSSPLANAQARRFSASRDADRVEAAIVALGKQVAVDRARTVLAGFSDGATFALAMGMARTHAFAAVIAWSPGIAIRAASPAKGRRVFISHGRQDPLLRFDETCGEIVPLVQSEGGAVAFMPFDGGHEAPPAVKDAFLDAAFGALPGAPPHPLPASVEKCIAPSHDQRMVG
jgi:phospholipase/carboxylesterase